MAMISDLMRALTLVQGEYGDVKVYFNDSESERYMAINSVGVMGARAESKTFCVLDANSNIEMMSERTLDFRVKN